LKKNTIKNFISDFLIFFTEINISFSFESIGYLPRWIIFMLDIFVVIISGFFSFLLLEGLSLNYIHTKHQIVAIALYIVINMFFFWIFKTYSGIIRHSSNVDALKLFFSQSFTFVTILFINFSMIFTYHAKLFLNTGIFLNSIISFSILFFYRILVKEVFEKIFIYSRGNNNNNNNKINAIIYGSDLNAVSVANALKSDAPGRFKIVGFIDKSNQNSNKRLLDLPIFKIKKSVKDLLQLQKVEALIIADKSLTNEETLTIVEECIEFGFKVFTLPSALDWEDKKEISKNIKNFQIQDLLERKPILLNTQAISSKLNGKTILISGAGGSIGSEIVRQLFQFNPEKIIILDQAETPLHSLSLEISEKNNNVKCCNVIADIRNYNLLDKIFEKYTPHVVYHAAAYKHVPMMEENPSQAILTNILGTKNIADLSNKHNVDCFVMISTDKAVKPSSVMGASKRIAEMYVQSKHLKHKENNSKNYPKFITTRFGNVLGSSGSVVPLFTKQIQEGGPITITHPDIIRYFMTIPEACQLVLEAGSMGSGGEIYIFDMGKPVKIIDLARKMIRLVGLIPDKDIQIKIIGLRPGEKLYEELLNDSAKNLATHHEKIMIAQEVCDKFSILNQQIEDLIQSAIDSNPKELVSKMKNIVPEFKSLNSVFQDLDN
jgi:nucleoside-diphosphate-sugar epimerase